MQLFARILGHGRPLVILHGLFGMSDNWLSIGKALTRHGFRVHIPDLRNHGRSPHAKTHRYPEMCDDLLEYLDHHGLDKIELIGHSMGGKLAMIFSLLQPERVADMVVVDIAPADYRRPENTFHRDLIATLLELDLNRYRTRGKVREELARRLQDGRLAGFLAKNIALDKDSGRMFWLLNLEVLQKHLQHLAIGLEELEFHAPCQVRTLFLKGDDSDYYLPQHEPARLLFFPHSRVVGIARAGHWLHSEQSERFLAEVLTFLGNEEGNTG